MKKLIPLLAIVLASFLALPLVAEAGNSTLSYTAGQSTAIQTQLIPMYNADHCVKFGLPTTCASADLVSAGCTTVTFKTIVYDSCTIFTADVTGEAAFLKEVANQHLVTTFNRLITAQVGLYNSSACTQWKALTPTQQQNDCTAHGLPTTCAGPCP